MTWPDFNSHHAVERFKHLPRPTCPPTCLGVRLWAWLLPQRTPSAVYLTGSFAPLFSGPRAFSSSHFLHSPSPKCSPPPELFLHRYGCSALYSTRRILDLQCLTPKTNRETDTRATSFHPPRWKDGDLSQPPDDTEFLLIHAVGWVTQEVPIRHRGTFKSLGVLYSINPNDSTSLQTMKQSLIEAVTTPLHAFTRNMSARCTGLDFEPSV